MWGWDEVVSMRLWDFFFPSPCIYFCGWCWWFPDTLGYNWHIMCKLKVYNVLIWHAEEPEIKLPTSSGSSKQQELQKNIHSCLIDYAKAFDYVDHNKLWKILKEMGIPDHLTCLLRNLYAGQEATARIGHGTNRKRSMSRLYIVTMLI